MNIALIGYGKMGKEIEKIAHARNHKIGLKIDKDNANLFTLEMLKDIDVAIEFSTPETVVQNINSCFNANVPIVVGTTGWYNHFKEIEQNCISKNQTLFYATNYSIGVNLFMKVNLYLAELMNNYPNYSVALEEIHHVHKLDKPSGTAITLAEQIISKIDLKKSWSITENTEDKLFIKDVREGEVPGTHIVKYQSMVDDIEIMHKAHNRQGFALGAVIAAEFLKGKKGIYNMSNLI